MKAPLPFNEEYRLEALRRYDVLDTMAEQAYDDLTLMAAHIAETSIAAITLIDRDRQWFKSKVGLDATETSREVAFCAHAILQPDIPLLVRDATQEERFADNPFVAGDPGIRFYFGAPLVTPDNFALGTLCVVDVAPRELRAEQIRALTALARQVMNLLELRRNATELRRAWEERDAHARQLEELHGRLECANVELRDAMEKADAANRAKSVFLATMSHDIRTPIAGVLGMSDLLLDLQLPGQQRDYVEGIKISAEGLLSLINDILDLSKVEAGKLELDLEELPLRTFLADIARIMGFAASKKGLELATVLDDGLPEAVQLDGPRLRQVLLNLMGNAVKFTAAGSVTLTVSSRVEGGRAALTFTVRDTGPGIPTSRRDAVFEPFAQAERSTSRQHGGTGLGLAICRRLVEAMGGALVLESEEGAGTTLCFTIDAEVTASPKRLAAAGAAETAELQRPLCVLVAEDNLVIQKVLGAMLRKQGHEADIASDGREAVEASAGRQYDLVLMDVEMPELDGWQATAAIRAREAASAGRVPIVAMTAHAMAGDEARCLAAGMDAYLSKPVRPDALTAVLRRLTSQAGAGTA